MPVEETTVPAPAKPHKRAQWAAVGGLSVVLLGAVALNAFPIPAKVDKQNPVMGALQGGTVKSVLVQPGMVLEAGDEIAFLNDEVEQSALDTARGEYRQVVEQISQMAIAVSSPTEPGIGGTIVQDGSFDPSPAQRRPIGPVQGVPRVKGPIKSLPKVEGTSETTLSDATDEGDTPPPTADSGPTLGDLKAKVKKAEEDISAARIELDQAKSASEESERAALQAQLAAQQSKANSERMQMMLKQGAIPLNQATQAETQATQAAVLAKQAATKADDDKAAIGRAEKAIEAAQERKREAEAAAALAVRVQPKPKPRPRIARSKPEFRIPAANPRAPKPAHVSRLSVKEAPAIPAKVDVDLQKRTQVEQKMLTAQTKVDEAEQALLQRRIVARRRMRVIKVLIKTGDDLKPGGAVIEFEPLPETPKPEPKAPESEPQAMNDWLRQTVPFLYLGEDAPGTLQTDELPNRKGQSGRSPSPK